MPSARAGRLSLRRSWLGRQHGSKRRIGVFAGAALFAAVVAVAAAGTFGGGGAKQAVRPPVKVAGGVSARTNVGDPTFSGGTLSSVAVTVNPDIADASVRVQVIHSDQPPMPTRMRRSLQEPTRSSSKSRVQQPPSTPGASGASTWSDMFSPSDWSGGCQSGLYRIAVVWVGPGTLFANPAASPTSGGGDESSWFSCKES